MRTCRTCGQILYGLYHISSYSFVIYTYIYLTFVIYTYIYLSFYTLQLQAELRFQAYSNGKQQEKQYSYLTQKQCINSNKLNKVIWKILQKVKEVVLVKKPQLIWTWQSIVFHVEFWWDIGSVILKI